MSDFHEMGVVFCSSPIINVDLFVLDFSSVFDVSLTLILLELQCKDIVENK